ncbi:hypothetical protein [Carnobacterium sp. ISL-102]|nr:hypothetical protein [Carnobacterium sp. ISL-102]
MINEKEAAQAIGINLKGKIGQYFCKHKNTQWFVQEAGLFHNI